MMRESMVKMMQDMWVRMVDDNYTRSMFAMFPLLQKIRIRALIESNLRVADGEVLDRPLGSPVVRSN